MKTKTLLLMSLILSLVVFSSCKDDDEDSSTRTEFEKSYFSVDDGKFMNGDFPETTLDQEISTIDTNNQAL